MQDSSVTKQFVSRVILAISFTVAISAVALNASAQDVTNYTRADIERWMHQYAGAKPDFKAGDVLGVKDLQRIKPFVAPGYLEQLNFPELKMPIVETRQHTPRKDFMACTEKYQGQVKLGPEGELQNYVCGQPFADSALDANDPKSGIKGAWNFEQRWQNYGLLSLNFLGVWDRFGGEHTGKAPVLIETPPPEWLGGLKFQSQLPTDASRFYGGGGTFGRIVAQFYQRLYLTHLAPIADQGGVLNIPNAKDYLWKDFTGFFSPFDVRGTVFIIYRYTDPHRADDAWAYDPKLRRVRRISAEAKSDSMLGTDTTIDDFYTFSGHQLQWNWKFLGWKDVLCVADIKDDYTHLYGPNGNIPDDVWSIRRVAVIERIPKQPNYPYSSVILLWDAENWHPFQAFMFNQKKKFWKNLTYVSRWSEDFKQWTEMTHGVDSSIMLGVLASDFQNRRATLFNGYGDGMPVVNLQHVSKLFDVNMLEEVHR